MDIAHVFYVVGIIASVIIIIVAVGLLIAAYLIYKKINEIKRNAEAKVNDIMDTVQDKMRLIPMGGMIASFLTPYLKRKIRK
jgi:predicted Holliday junction resolvase-like endonuclease